MVICYRSSQKPIQVTSIRKYPQILIFLKPDSTDNSKASSKNEEKEDKKELNAILGQLVSLQLGIEGLAWARFMEEPTLCCIGNCERFVLS